MMNHKKLLGSSAKVNTAAATRCGRTRSDRATSAHAGIVSTLISSGKKRTISIKLKGVKVARRPATYNPNGGYPNGMAAELYEVNTGNRKWASINSCVIR